MMEREQLLEIKDLSISFKLKARPVQVVRGVDFGVGKGEILGILGESGSGKSVTSTAILGLFKDEEGILDAGEIIYKGQDLLKINDKDLRKIRGKEISYIFQDPVGALNPYRRVGKQVRETLKNHGLPSSKELVLEVMRDVGLDNAELIYDMYPFQLSGGQCQRVVIAMAIACRPELLIADEPTSAIDASLQKKVLGLLKEINGKYGTSVIIITHDFAVARYLCHRLVIMYGGMVMEEGYIEDVLNNPQHPYTIELLKCVNSLTSNDDVLYTLEGRAPNPTEFNSGCPFFGRCKVKMAKCENQLPELKECGEQHQLRCWQVGV